MAINQITRKPLVVNDRFGRWVVCGAAESKQLADRVKRFWHCLCDCGTGRAIAEESLLRGKSKSCGCGQREAVAKAGLASATHGMSKSAPEYYIWGSMKQRCLNPNVRNWADYGGRGITVCDRWIESFEAFYADMGPRPTPLHSIDRIDNDDGYHPKNCEWSDLDHQVRNRRSNIVVTLDGVEMVLTDAARISGVKYTTARARLVRGWSLNRALERTP